MTRNSQQEETAPEVKVVALSRVREDFGNHRWETSPTKTVGTLAKSLQEHGLLQPPLVRPHPAEPEAYQVVYGHRRVMAARLLGWEEVRVEVRDLGEAAEVRLVQLQENLQQLALTPIEEAFGIERMVRLDRKPQRLVAEELGLDKAGVSRRLKLLTLDSSVQEKIHTGALSAAHGTVLQRLLKADPELQGHFASRVVEEQLSAELLESYIKEHLETQDGREEEELLEVRIPPMDPTPTKVFSFKEGMLPAEGAEDEATAEQADRYLKVLALACLVAFNDHELRDRELGLPLPFDAATVGVIFRYVEALSAGEAEALVLRMGRRFIEAGHRKGMIPRELADLYLDEELSASPPGAEKGGFS